MPTRNTILDNLIKLALSVLHGASEEERVLLFDSLTEVYCQHCGSRHRDSPGGHCQCENDE